MTDATWLNYLAATTGVVGMLTGVAGAVMGYVGYRRSVKVKALDLRLELKKAENELRYTASALPKLLEYAKQSHERVSAAIGLYKSGAMQAWHSEWDNDLALVASLLPRVPAADADYSKLSDPELEA